MPTRGSPIARFSLGCRQKSRRGLIDPICQSTIMNGRMRISSVVGVPTIPAFQHKGYVVGKVWT